MASKSVSRVEPKNLADDELICPVCIEPIEKDDRVLGPSRRHAARTMRLREGISLPPTTE